MMWQILQSVLQWGSHATFATFEDRLEGHSLHFRHFYTLDYGRVIKLGKFWWTSWLWVVYTSCFRTDIDLFVAKIVAIHCQWVQYERQQSTNYWVTPRLFLLLLHVTSNHLSHLLAVSLYIFIGISVQYSRWGRSEWGKLAKNYPMPISPPLWPEWWPHWARPKVPTTTIEKRHNSNNIARAKSKSPWWTYKNMQ